MSMVLSFVFLVAGIVLLGKGADWLVRGGSALALHFGVTPLVIGLTVVALGTSMPELVTSLLGGSTIAIGNAVGSNLMNLGLILGLTALIAPIHCQRGFLRFELPLMVAVGPLLWLVMRDGTISRIEGALFVTGLIVYIAVSVIRGRKEPDEKLLHEAEEFLPKDKANLLASIGFLLVGMVALIAGGKGLVHGAIDIARWLGVTERIIAVTIVAGGTSLPELATCIVAARKGEQDIALGNVIGSNIFNILGILGVCAVVNPLATPAGSLELDVPAVIIVQALCIPLMLWQRVMYRPEGFILLISYAVYLLLLFLR